MASTLPRTDARRYQERAAATRLMLSRETALEKHLVRVISGFGKRAAHSYILGGEDGIAEALRPFKGEVARVLRPSMLATAKAFGERVVSGAKSVGIETKAFESLDEEIDAFLSEHTADRVVDISDSLKTTIAGIVRRGLDENLGEQAVAQAIVEATSGEIAAARARRIARTETHTASQAGQLAAAKASSLQYEKEWLATEDNRTRPDHAAANGQRVGLDEPFIVGGEEMQMPGDPNASASQIINCRCVMLMNPIAGGGSQVGPADLLTDPEAWAAWYRTLKETGVTPDDVVLYVLGPEVSLAQFASAETIEQLIGVEIEFGGKFIYGVLDPRQIDTNGLQDSFPLWGRPVVVKITVPAGTRAAAGPASSTEVQLRENVRIRITGVSEETWGDVQEEAGVDIDNPPRNRRYRRAGPKKGITLVEAEVVNE